MNIFDILLSLALVACVGLAVRSVVRRRKSGGCACCGGGCEGCKRCGR